MLPRWVVRVRRAVRHLTGLDGDEAELAGERIEQSWYDMMARMRSRDREVERRLNRAERALNRLSL